MKKFIVFGYTNLDLHNEHDEPTQEKLEQLSLICKDFGHEISITGDIKKTLNGDVIHIY